MKDRWLRLEFAIQLGLALMILWHTAGFVWRFRGAVLAPPAQRPREGGEAGDQRGEGGKPLRIGEHGIGDSIVESTHITILVRVGKTNSI